MRRLAIAILFTVACGGVAPAPTTTLPAARPRPAPPPPTLVPPIGTDSPAPPPPTSPAPRVVRAPAVGPLPGEFRYVGVQWVDAARVWLVDLSGKKLPLLVASWGISERVRTLAPDDHWSVTRDGKAVVVSAPSPAGPHALYLVRPERGEVSLLREDPTADLIAPRISPDGERVAFGRHLRAPTGANPYDGVWSAATRDGTATRLADPAQAPEVEIPVAWSHDGAWLAYLRSALGTSTLFVVEAKGGASTRVGFGRASDWRAREPRVALVSSDPRGGDSFLSTYDVSSRQSATLHGPTRQLLARPRWHPSEDRVLYLESTGPAFAPSLLQSWVRDLAGNATRRGGESHYVDVWWSPDGARVFGLVGGDDSVWGIVDVDARRSIGAVCTRGDAPPCP